MKRIRLMGLALIAIFALAALASASAFAENPEILPVPTAANPAKFTSTAGKTELHTTKDVKTVCQKAKNKGQFTSQDLGTVDITFEECTTEEGKVTCKSPGQATGVILVEGEMDLVDVLPTGTLDLGVAITPHQDGNVNEMLSYTCGLIKALILGTVIGVVDNAAGNLLKDLEKFNEVKVLWKQNAELGEQEIKECDLLKAFCEEGGKKKLFLLLADFGKGHELAAEIADATLLFEKTWEVHF
jgi:hypothetical protein